MAGLARADLESLLRARKLDRTLTTTLPPPSDTGLHDSLAVSATDCPPLDARLGGGLPRGQLSELVGPRSSGRTSLLLRMLAAATARGELVALIDVLDRFDAADAPSDAIRRLPFTTWLRLQRMVEGSQTTCVLVGGERLARSSAGLTLQLGIDGSGAGIRFKGRMLDGLTVDARVVRSRARPQEQADVRVSLSTTCA